MDKKLAKEVIEKSNGFCEMCGARGEQIHHVFGGNGKRIKTERIECLSYLCKECHLGKNGAHHNRGIDLMLKIKSQNRLLNQGYTEDEVREIVGGKLY